jgi:hypothetical protein
MENKNTIKKTKTKTVRMHEVRIYTGVGCSRNVSGRLLPRPRALAIAKKLRKWGHDAYVPTSFFTISLKAPIVSND